MFSLETFLAAYFFLQNYSRNKIYRYRRTERAKKLYVKSIYILYTVFIYNFEYIYIARFKTYKWSSVLRM